MVCCKTNIKPSTKLVIVNNIGFFGGAFWLRFFNVKVLKGYYIFWIVKINGYTKKEFFNKMPKAKCFNV